MFLKVYVELVNTVCSNIFLSPQTITNLALKILLNYFQYTSHIYIILIVLDSQIFLCAVKSYHLQYVEFSLLSVKKCWWP